MLHRLSARVRARWARRAEGQLPPAIPDPLDAYGRDAPGMQATLDIFKNVWSSRFPAEYGVQAGEADLFDDVRIRWLLERVDVEGRRILELGPLEGAHSTMLERAGAASIVAIEACVMSYLKCLIVKELLGLRRVRFLFGNFMPFLAACHDRFDVILASGVLYHQQDPISCIQRMAARADAVFIWTHYYDEGISADRMASGYFRRTVSPPIEGFACELFRLEYDTYLKGVKYRGGVDACAHWMRKADILACLRHFGLSDIELAFDVTEHPYGPNMALLARRPAPAA